MALVMDAWYDVTSQLPEVPLADCRFNSINITSPSSMLKTQRRFAFVEYESRRDADDAYHEMHNKRLGRDDILKIEVKRGFKRITI